jgi:hypothetical protein
MKRARAIVLGILVALSLFFAFLIYPTIWAYYETGWDVSPGGEYRVHRITRLRQVHGHGAVTEWVNDGVGKLRSYDREWNFFGKVLD